MRAAANRRRRPFSGMICALRWAKAAASTPPVGYFRRDTPRDHSISDLHGPDPPVPVRRAAGPRPDGGGDRDDLPESRRRAEPNGRGAVHPDRCRRRRAAGRDRPRPRRDLRAHGRDLNSGDDGLLGDAGRQFRQPAHLGGHVAMELRHRQPAAGAQAMAGQFRLAAALPAGACRAGSHVWQAALLAGLPGGAGARAMPGRDSLRRTMPRDGSIPCWRPS